MTDEEILAHLSSNEGRTIVVKDIWYFTGRSMQCCSTDEDYTCCDESYDTFEDALEAIRDLATGTKPEVL